MAIDVTVVHPLLPSGYVFRGDATRRAEARKKRRYDETCSMAGVSLVPFATTTFATFGSVLLAWITHRLKAFYCASDLFYTGHIRRSLTLY